MAHLEDVKLQITVDFTEISEARVRVKRLIKDATELNRLLARAQEQLLGFEEDLRERGIQIETEI